jgi:peptide-methionine (R)-S-oxide reductase
MNNLTPEESAVIVDKHTEPAFVGEYDKHFKDGTYVCRRCDNALFSSETKFNSGCGWPSFDSHFPGSVKEIPDADGYRTEIVCAQCGGHLGHVFTGENFTDKDTRHCVNSLSIRFVAKEA